MPRNRDQVKTSQVQAVMQGVQQVVSGCYALTLITSWRLSIRGTITVQRDVVCFDGMLGGQVQIHFISISGYMYAPGCN
jgi:hypothetical protein